MKVSSVHRGFYPEMRAAANGPLEASWDANPRSIDSSIAMHWHALVARSRLAANDDGFFSRYLDLAQDNIVGHRGIRVESTPIGKGDKVDRAAKDALDDAWEEFSERGVFDVTGGLSRAQFERAWVNSKVMNGEAICLIVYDKDLPWGMGVQMIDPMRLDVRFNQDLSGGHYIRHSIEYNAYGRPIAYHIARETSFNTYGSYGYASVDRDRVPAEFVVHDFCAEFVGQKRGLPWARSILWRLRQFSRAEDSMIANLRASASKMGFFYTDGRDEEPERAGEEGAGDERIAIDNQDAEMYDIGSKRFVPYNPNFPDAAVEPFMRTLAKGISSGVGVNYYKLFNDLTAVSFSSIRQGELSERDFWKRHQEETIDNLVKPIRRAWLKFSLMSGKIAGKNRAYRADEYARLKYADYKGRGWSWIDPQSEAAANALMMERNMKSLSDILSEQGTDFWSVIEQISQERKDLDEAGIPIITTPGGGVMASPGKKPDDGTNANAK